MGTNNITAIKRSIVNIKIVHTLIARTFLIFKLLAKKSLAIFPKHREYIFISESFALNWYIFPLLRNKRLLLLLWCRGKQNFLFDLEKLIEYWGSTVNVVLSNPCAGSFARIEIFFFLLSICAAQMSSYRL